MPESGPLFLRRFEDLRNAITVAELAERFDETHITFQLKPNTQKEYRRAIQLYILPAFGTKQVAAVAQAQIHDPFAPIGRPEDLFEDPHLIASGGLEEVTLPDGTATRLPVLPIAFADLRLGQASELATVPPRH